MERFIMDKLKKWKTSPYRKPLLLTGPKGCGKTWILKEFGRLYYKNTAYFNFGDSDDYEQFFQSVSDVKRIITNLVLASGNKIVPGDTLIIFDNIQTSSRVTESLKYFCELGSEYHVVATSCYSGFSYVSSFSFPVGKVNFLKLNPMSFSEFLLACGKDNLVQYMNTLEQIEAIPNIVFSTLFEMLKVYFIVGGMPSSVLSYVENNNLDNVDTALDKINRKYNIEFTKTPHPCDINKVFLIWESIPLQGAKENKKFYFNCVKTGARCREYYNALDFLIKENMVYKVNRNTKPCLPFASSDELSSYKLYLNDVGLLRKMFKISPSSYREGDKIFTSFNNALSETFVLQSLINQFENNIRYWSQCNPPYDVSFTVQRDNDIIPLDVQIGYKAIMSSLSKYGSLFSSNTKLKVRYSFDNLELREGVLNIPLFMADFTDKLIGLALR